MMHFLHTKFNQEIASQPWLNESSSYIFMKRITWVRPNYSVSLPENTIRLSKTTMNSSLDRRTSIIFIVIAATLWSTSGVLLKIIDWQPIAILAGRSIFSSIVLFIYLRRIPTKWTRWKLLASVAYILTQFLYIWSIKLTTAANAIFLQYTAPVYVILLALWFLHERPSRVDWSSMLIIFIGMILFFGDKLSAQGFYGNILAVISGITSALMIVSMRAQKDGVPAESILAANIFTAIMGIPFILKESWTVTNWFILLYLGTI